MNRDPSFRETPGRSYRPAPARRAPPPGSESWAAPWVQLKYFSFHPNFFPNMIAAASPDAKAGDVVTVYDKEGNPFGHGFYNFAARVPVRVFQHGAQPLAEDHFEKLLRDAVALRLDTLRLPEQTDAFRVINSDADRIPGLMVDKFGDVLSVEVTTLAAQLRLREWLPLLHELLGTKSEIIQFDENARRAESVRDSREEPSNAPEEARVTENGVRFRVNFASGHKTGFFCDQRDNRQRFASWVRGKRVLDVCCYTGGFAVSAAKQGAAEVTAVDLDEKAIEQAKRNANLNQCQVSFSHVDAFSFMRQMQRNGTTWEAVILDPPKLVHSREGFEEGRAKYHDLNKLALSLVAPGGLFVTCSCSGLMPPEVFEEIVVGIAHRNGRKLQILDRTGASADHPVMSNCPESRYLKVLWARVW